MSTYLFQIELPEVTDEIASVIPKHREHINKLLRKGRILSYSISQSKNFLWCILEAEDEKDAMEVISNFPLRKFFADVSCHELLFHDAIPSALPEISWN